MNTLLSSQRSDKIQLDWLRIAQWGLVAILALITLYNVYFSMLENVAHDAMPYMEDYVGKFVSEGRWINFALFPILKAVPQVIAVSLCSLFVFVLLFILFLLPLRFLVLLFFSLSLSLSSPRPSMPVFSYVRILLFAAVF